MKKEQSWHEDRQHAEVEQGSAGLSTREGQLLPRPQQQDAKMQAGGNTGSNLDGLTSIVEFSRELEKRRFATFEIQATHFYFIFTTHGPESFLRSLLVLLGWKA